MDDPLSAVDAHVGRSIMDNAICGLLKDRCRVLATHQLHFLSQCDRVIIMKDGHIDAMGTFEELMTGNAEFKMNSVAKLFMLQMSANDHENTLTTCALIMSPFNRNITS